MAGPSAAFDVASPTRVSVLRPPSTPLPAPTADEVNYIAKVNSQRKPYWAKETGGYALLSGNGPGVAITNNVSSLRGNLHLFRPTGGQSVFDLDVEDRDRFLFVSVIFTQSNRTSNSIGFEEGLNPPNTIRKTGRVHLQDVFAAGAFQTGSMTAKDGFEVLRAPVWEGTDELGRHEMWVVKEATTNYLGFFLPYTGGASVASGGADLEHCHGHQGVRVIMRTPAHNGAEFGGSMRKRTLRSEWDQQVGACMRAVQNGAESDGGEITGINELLDGKPMCRQRLVDVTESPGDWCR